MTQKIHVRVKAIDTGFMFGRRIRAGEVFSTDVDVDQNGKPVMRKWFIQVDEPKVAKAPGSPAKAVENDDAFDLV